jgi:hypothetical protein
MTDSCAHYRNLIPAMIIGDPDSAILESLLAHVAGCPSCAKEVEAYQQTLSMLKTVPDYPVPRHFFVYGEAAARSPWALFRQLQPSWRIALAGAAAAMLLMVLALAAGTQVRYEDGTLAIAFGRTGGSPVAPGQPGISTLKTELLNVMEARLQQQAVIFKSTLRTEFAGLESTLSEQQKELLQAGFMRLENHVNDRIQTTQAALQSGTERSMGNLYQLLREERQQDVAAITDRIDMVAARSEAKSDQTDAILSTLLDVAEQRVKN